MIKPKGAFNQKIYDLKMKLYDLKTKLYDYRNNAIMKGKVGLFGSDIYLIINGYINKAMYIIGPDFLKKYQDTISFKEMENVINNFEVFRNSLEKDINSFDLASVLLVSIALSNIIEDKDDRNTLAITTAFVSLDPPFINNRAMSTGPYFSDLEDTDISAYKEFRKSLNDVEFEKIKPEDSDMFSSLIYLYYTNRVYPDKLDSLDTKKGVKIKKKI